MHGEKNCGLGTSVFSEEKGGGEDLFYCTANSDIRARGEGALLIDEMYELSVRDI